MRLLLILGGLFLALCGEPANAGPWSFTLYGGPATYTIFTQALSGKAKIDGGLIGIAADRRLAYLGWGFNLMGEVQVQQFAFGPTYNSFALGLGVEYHHFPWEASLPMAASVYLGPTYSIAPPQIYPTDSLGSRKGLLNYLSIEFAFALPQARKWDAVFRLYHRSGLWGVYTLDPDEATVFCVGIRYRM